MLDPSWLPSIRSYLYQDERDCLFHINNDTFEEKPFIDYFMHWDQYYSIIRDYGEKDIYDASHLSEIANYYNDKTNTTNYYNPSTGEKGTQPPKYYSNGENNTSSNQDNNEERIKNIAIGVGIAIVVLFMLKSCARGEEIKNKYTLVDNNGKKIEFMDNNYQETDNNDEIIYPSDYQVKTR